MPQEKGYVWFTVEETIEASKTSPVAIGKAVGTSVLSMQKHANELESGVLVKERPILWEGGKPDAADEQLRSGSSCWMKAWA